MLHEKQREIWLDIEKCMNIVKKIRAIAEKESELLPNGHKMFGECLSQLECVRRTFQD